MTTALAVLLAALPLALAGSVAMPEQASAARPTTIVALTFDDGYASHLTAARMLAKRGMRATFYVNSATLGKRGRLTRRQLAAIAKAGHEIAGHTLHHARLDSLSPEEQWTEICDDRRALLTMGFPVRTFAYPFGAWDGTARQTVRDCGYNAARGVGGLSVRRCSGCTVAEPYRPESLYLIRTPGSVRATTTLAQIEQLVRNAEKDGGGLVPLVFHRLCDGRCELYSTDWHTFGAFLDWLAKRTSRGTVVRRLGDVIGGKVRPVPAG